MKIDRVALLKVLTSSRSESIAWYLSRCAIRALPLIPPYRPIHLSFIAVDQAIAASKYHSTGNAYRSARHASDEASKLSADASSYAAARSAAYVAWAIEEIHDPRRLEMYSTYATDAAFSAASYSDKHYLSALVESLNSDLTRILTNVGTEELTANLWCNGRDDCEDRIELFLSRLRRNGLEYWAREFESWSEGDFSLPRIIRRSQLSDEIIAAGFDATMAFLESDTFSSVSEARVILIGDGGAGKTSIIRRLHDEELRPSEKATPGVFVREEKEDIGGETVRVHYWDFGGQVFLHATHQLFLRERCVNIVVIKARETGERDMAEYWLEHVRVFGGGSPTIIVQNQVDAVAKGMDTPMPFDKGSILRRYPFVLECLNLSCLNDDGLDGLRKAIFQALSTRRILDQKTLPSWFALKESLRSELPFASHIGDDRFNEICDAVSLVKDQRKAALTVMDQLGVALHFPQVDSGWYILDPSWLTKAIYHLLWRASEDASRGILTVESLRSAFDSASDPAAPNVPEDKFESLLRLLVCFGVAYEHSEGSFRVPMLAADREPRIALPGGESIGFVVKMTSLLPPLLFHRFVAQCGGENEDDLLWLNGCMLSYMGATARVQMLRLEREIRIEVWGEPRSRGRYQTILRRRLLNLLSDDVAYQKLEYAPYFELEGRNYDWVPCLSAYSDSQNRAYDTKGGSMSMADVMQSAYGLPVVPFDVISDELRSLVQINKDLIGILHGGAMARNPINIEVNPHIEFRPNIVVESHQVVSIEVNIRNLSRFRTVLEDMEFEIRRQKYSEEEVGGLKEDIQELKKIIAEYRANRADDTGAEEDRAGLWDRIKRLATRVVLLSTFSNNLSSIAANIPKIFPTWYM